MRLWARMTKDLGAIEVFDWLIDWFIYLFIHSFIHLVSHLKVNFKRDFNFYATHNITLVKLLIMRTIWINICQSRKINTHSAFEVISMLKFKYNILNPFSETVKVRLYRIEDLIILSIELQNLVAKLNIIHYLL